MKYLIVGLGNIGAEYHETRHNIGFMVLDAFAEASNTLFKTGRYGDTAEVRVKNRTLLLLKPSTYMNLSGNAVRYWMQHEEIPLERVLIIVDDVAIPFGTLRMKSKGSSAGHNGLSHIEETIKSAAYPRLRFGIGNDYPRGMQIEYVLGKFFPEEQRIITPIIERAIAAIKTFCLAGVNVAMNQCNTKAAPKPEPPSSNE